MEVRARPVLGSGGKAIRCAMINYCPAASSVLVLSRPLQNKNRTRTLSEGGGAGFIYDNRGFRHLRLPKQSHLPVSRIWRSELLRAGWLNPLSVVDSG